MCKVLFMLYSIPSISHIFKRNNNCADSNGVIVVLIQEVIPASPLGTVHHYSCHNYTNS